jgi:hypothetical protein
MKSLVSIIGLFLAACGTLPFQPTAVNQYPTPLPTPTLAVETRPIHNDEMEEALNFFYELKIQMALGEYEHFAEEIRYPITVKVDGQPRTFIFAVEFEANFEKIFSEDAIQRFISTDESELTFTPNGVKVADGIVWFDLICMDPECENAEFLITQINN